MVSACLPIVYVCTGVTKLRFLSAFSLGKGAAAGAAAVGLGALCYYGIGMGKHTSIADNAM